MSKPYAKSSSKPWSGMCPTGKHGLDYEGQKCDLCAHHAGCHTAKRLSHECRACRRDKTNKIEI